MTAKKDKEINEKKATKKEDINVDTLLVFIPPGEEKFSLIDSYLDMTCSISDEGEKTLVGELKTNYCFPDTNLGEVQTWRYHFYDVQIKEIYFSSSTEDIIYRVTASDFSVEV